MVEAIIGLGSNVGDRENNIGLAVSALKRFGRLSAVSSVYETEPMYYKDQGWFLNCVVALETDLSPRALLDALLSTESALGRVRGVKYGPRIIDLDILFYDGLVISEPGLQVPHPLLAERLFVIAPLAEIRPALVHPVLGRTAAQLAEALGTDKSVRRYGPPVRAGRREPPRP